MSLHVEVDDAGLVGRRGLDLQLQRPVVERDEGQLEEQQRTLIGRVEARRVRLRRENSRAATRASRITAATIMIITSVVVVTGPPPVKLLA